MPRMPLELELGISLSNPTTVSEYSQSIKGTLRDVRLVAHDNLSRVRANQISSSSDKTKSWIPYEAGEMVWLSRPKKWKLGPKWIRPYTIVTRLGIVNYKVRSETGKIVVFHHNHLKPYFAPNGPPNVFCPSREYGDFTVVESVQPPSNTPHSPNPPQARATPTGLRQRVPRPTWHDDYVLY